MPVYEFSCEKCNSAFDELCSFEDSKKTKCPKCKSKKVTRLFSPPTIQFADPKGTSKMDNADWAFRYKYDQATGERRRAEDAAKAAKDTTKPYVHIDDIAGGSHFGEVS